MSAATIIKATKTADFGTLERFHFGSVEEQARRIVADAKKQAAELLEAAKAEIEQLREAERNAVSNKAYAEGFEKGLQEGRIKGEAEGLATGDADARKEFAAETTPAAAALSEALHEIQTQRTELRQNAESELLSLAVRIAERIVRRELTINPGAVVPQVTALIAQLADRSRVTVILNPQDMQVVQDHTPALHREFADLSEVELRADETVTRGGVRIRAGSGEAAIDIDRALSDLADAVLGTGDRS
jgi:flagellar assembly protein FliH